MKIGRVLALAMIPFAIGVLGNILSDAQILKIGPDAVPWVQMVLWICIFGTVLIFMLELGQRLHEEKLGIEAQQRQLSALKALPSFVVMKDRRDHFVFERNGTAHLTWTFEIESDGKTTEVLFPIFAERIDQDGLAKSAVKVEELVIDGERKDLADVYVLGDLRNRVKPPFLMEFGSLHLRLPRKKKHCRVVLKLKLSDSFPNLERAESVYVDIPILTERIRVILEAPAGARLTFPSSRADALVATLGVVDIPDPEETLRQKQQWGDTADGKIEWETQYPKLGYRYRLSFCLRPDPVSWPSTA